MTIVQKGRDCVFQLEPSSCFFNQLALNIDKQERLRQSPVLYKRVLILKHSWSWLIPDIVNIYIFIIQ